MMVGEEVHDDAADHDLYYQVLSGETASTTKTSLNQHSKHVERNDRVGVILLMSIRH